MNGLLDLFSLAGKVSLVTGAARGIGRGVAESLALAGSHVVLADIDGDGAEASAEAVRAAGGSAGVWETDVADEQSVKDLVQHVRKDKRRLDVIVNGAAIFPYVPLRDLEAATWDRVQAVNLRGAFLVTRLGAELMIEAGNGGRIVNISSHNTRMSRIGMAHYDASKGGLEALTRSSALEYAPFGITANALAPGAVITPGAMANIALLEKLGGTAEQVIEDFGKKIPYGRWAEPEDIGRAVLCIVAPAAAYITGQTIYVDGGLTLSV